jgi:hypothetical protein
MDMTLRSKVWQDQILRRENSKWYGYRLDKGERHLQEQFTSDKLFKGIVTCDTFIFKNAYHTTE